jgi:hypothetical protein
VFSQAESPSAPLSCYAQSFENGIWHATWAGEAEFSAAPGWLWLLGAGDAEGLKASHRKQRFANALKLLDGRHVGECPLWLRWSHPSENVSDLLASWHRYSVWWRRVRPGAIDLVGAVDRGANGEQVWHIHGYGFGDSLQLAQHASAWGRSGGYPFVKARRLPGGSQGPKDYLLRKTRGYISAKQGARRLRLVVA